jgi:N utilization substance protein B
MNRRRVRILAMQALCQLDAQGADFLAELDRFLSSENDDVATQAHARRLVNGCWEHRAEIDAALAAAATHWELKRMDLVDRNILRVAACELLHLVDAPRAVVIDEAVEIAKTYGSADSGAFVNGVLDALPRARSTP